MNVFREWGNKKMRKGTWELRKVWRYLIGYKVGIKDEKVRLKEYLEFQENNNGWNNRCEFNAYFFNGNCDKCWYKEDCSDCLRSMDIVK